MNNFKSNDLLLCSGLYCPWKAPKLARNPAILQTYFIRSGTKCHNRIVDDSEFSPGSMHSLQAYFTQLNSYISGTCLCQKAWLPCNISHVTLCHQAKLERPSAISCQAAAAHIPAGMLDPILLGQAHNEEIIGKTARPDHQNITTEHSLVSSELHATYQSPESSLTFAKSFTVAINRS